MASEIGEATGRQPRSPSSSGSGGNDAGDFECNICFELASDPVVTLCGHLFCWPCLFRWLRLHSHSHECPVCKALIQEEKLVPLYGRGKTSSDPRSKPVPGVEIPNRPAGQRPETAPPPEANNFPNFGFGLMGGFMPMATARFGNFAMSAGFGGLFPSLFNIQFHGFPDATVYGTTSGFPYGFSGASHGTHAHGYPHGANQGQQADNYLRMLLLLISAFFHILSDYIQKASAESAEYICLNGFSSSADRESTSLCRNQEKSGWVSRFCLDKRSCNAWEGHISILCAELACNALRNGCEFFFCLLTFSMRRKG
ncbi:hypothetical protein NMG60_11008037 [Bertholletia excelsa]